MPSDTQLELGGYQRATRQADRPQAVTGTNHQAQFMLLTAATVTGHLATVLAALGAPGLGRQTRKGMGNIRSVRHFSCRMRAAVRTAA